MWSIPMLRRSTRVRSIEAIPVRPASARHFSSRHASWRFRADAGRHLGLYVLLFGLSVGPAGWLQAQEGVPAPVQDSGVYTWVDKAGVYHMVDSLEKVPAAERAAVKARASAFQLIEDRQGGNYSSGGTTTTAPGAPASMPPSAAPAPPTSSGAATTGSVPASTSGPSAAPGAATTAPPAAVRDQAYWQQRIQSNLEQKARSQAEIQRIDAETLRVRTLTPTNFLATLQDLQVQRKTEEALIIEAERQLTEVIPLEAQREGVPPGWLR